MHKVLKRATPNAITNYNHALLLHKTYNSSDQNKDWIDIHSNQSFNNRSNKVNFYNNSNNKQGKNILCNRFTTINNKIEYAWLNLPFN